MAVENLAILDYFTIPNALFPSIDPVPGVVSFTVEWSIDAHVFNVSDDEQDYQGVFKQSQLPEGARVAWQASNEEGFSYTSDPLETSSNHFAILGHERNGDLRFGRWGMKHPRPR